MQRQHCRSFLHQIASRLKSAGGGGLLPSTVDDIELSRSIKLGSFEFPAPWYLLRVYDPPRRLSTRRSHSACGNPTSDVLFLSRSEWTWYGAWSRSSIFASRCDSPCSHIDRSRVAPLKKRMPPIHRRQCFAKCTGNSTLSCTSVDRSRVMRHCCLSPQSAPQTSPSPANELRLSPVTEVNTDRITRMLLAMTLWSCTS